MKIKDFQLKKVNITALFDRIDQSQITSDAIRNLLRLKPEDKEKTPFIDLPGTKVLTIPTLRKEIVIESNRLRVSDASSKEVEKSKVVGDFRKVYEEFKGKSKLRAYGFNYDILLQLQRNIPYNKFLSANLKRLIKDGELLEVGARIIYKKGHRRIDIQLVPGGKEKQLGIHANVHYESKAIDFNKLPSQLANDYKEVKQAVSRFTEG